MNFYLSLGFLVELASCTVAFQKFSHPSWYCYYVLLMSRYPPGCENFWNEAVHTVKIKFVPLD